MSDSISRQAAIDAVAEGLKRVFVESQDIAEKMIGSLPSAQPDPDEWCLDCKEYDKERHNCPRWNRVIKHTVEDLKAEQPERKKGKWIERNPLDSDKCRLIECSECGNAYIVDMGLLLEDWAEGRNFCIRCGADMRQKGADNAD